VLIRCSDQVDTQDSNSDSIVVVIVFLHFIDSVSSANRAHNCWLKNANSDVCILLIDFLLSVRGAAALSNSSEVQFSMPYWVKDSDASTASL
jgi:hypothetical protein